MTNQHQIRAILDNDNLFIRVSDPNVQKKLAAYDKKGVNGRNGPDGIISPSDFYDDTSCNRLLERRKAKINMFKSVASAYAGNEQWKEQYYYRLLVLHSSLYTYKKEFIDVMREHELTTYYPILSWIDDSFDNVEDKIIYLPPEAWAKVKPYAKGLFAPDEISQLTRELFTIIFAITSDEPPRENFADSLNYQRFSHSCDDGFVQEVEYYEASVNPDIQQTLRETVNWYLNGASYLLKNYLIACYGDCTGDPSTLINKIDLIPQIFSGSRTVYTIGGYKDCHEVKQLKKLQGGKACPGE